MHSRVHVTHDISELEGLPVVQLRREYLYFCTSKASKLSTWRLCTSQRTLRSHCLLSPTAHTCRSIRQYTSAYVSIHTSAYVSIRQHTSAYVSIRQHTSAYVSIRQRTAAYVRIRQHTAALRGHCRKAVAQPPLRTPRSYIGACGACVSIRQHTSAYVSIRQHTSAYVSIRQHTSRLSPTAHTFAA